VEITLRVFKEKLFVSDRIVESLETGCAPSYKGTIPGRNSFKITFVKAAAYMLFTDYEEIS